MKTFFVLASLAACALAQRLHIQEPTAGQTFAGNATITVELEQDVRPILRLIFWHFLNISASNLSAHSGRPLFSSR